MKKVKILIPTALAAPLAVAPFITSCSCSYDNEIKDLMDKMNTKFGSESVEFSKTKVNTATDEICQYATMFASDEAKKNEILFACFNFVGKDGLTINANKPTNDVASVQMTPNNKSFYDLYKDGTVQVNMGYNVNVNNVVSNQYFDFTMSAYFNCVYTKDVDGFKTNDFIQFAYELLATTRVSFVAVEDTTNNKFDMNVSYSFVTNDATQSFGFIQMRKAGTNYPAVSINNMSDANFDNNNCYYRGYYNKSN